jgi:hypothetical protein
MIPNYDAQKLNKLAEIAKSYSLRRWSIWKKLKYCIVVFAPIALGEQTYVTRYDVFAGYARFESPTVSLSEQGFHFQIGIRPAKWYSLGFDYSNVSGDLTLTPDLLPDALQKQLRQQLALLAAAGRLPAGYTLVVPVRSSTQTFTVGPQVAIRKWTRITPFVRPSCGFVREVAEPNPSDPIAQGIVAQLAPGGVKRDWTGFYGAGGGIDFNVTPHFALRVQADYVWDHLFPDILKDGRPTLRFSVGPAFNFGRNILR